jgi:NAD(P)H-quinone oxidoreductase subunit 5
MTTSLALLVATAPLALLAVAVLGTRRPGPDPHPVVRAGTWATAGGVVVAAGAGLAVAVRGSIETPTLGGAELGLSLRLDALSVVMLAMISLLAVAIWRFSAGYLDGDARHGSFLARLAATVAAVEVLVVSGSLALLVLAWIATSLALHQLLRFYPDRPGAVVAARKKFLVARIGDGFLIAAAALLIGHFGTGDLQEIFDAVAAAGPSGWALDATGLAAAFVAVAAILKSAQIPTHGWLIEVMETPTPVSALLHAGILNAGPFLVTRLAFVVDGADLATALLIAVGGGTALVASVALLTQPAVKSVLAYSSVAHMGFMLFVCGLGVYPAAMLHLVAHSFYKAHAFLSTGSVIDEARAARVALPRRLGRPTRVAASVVVATALYLALAATWGVDVVRDPALLALGVVLVLGTAQIVAPALDSDGPLAGAARAVVAALGVTLAFFSLEAGAHELLYGALPSAADRGAVQVALVVGVLVSFGIVVLLQILHPAWADDPRRRRWAVHLRNGLYVNAVLDRVVGALKVPTPAGERP